MQAQALGTSLLLLAIGAILAFAVSAQVSGVAIPTIGVILMVVGGIGLLISLFSGMSFYPWGGHGHGDHVDEVDHYERR